VAKCGSVVTFSTTWAPTGDGGVILIVATLEEGEVFRMELASDDALENLAYFAQAAGMDFGVIGSADDPRRAMTVALFCAGIRGDRRFVDSDEAMIDSSLPLELAEGLLSHLCGQGWVLRRI
jgi:hypothetical protein